MARGRARADGSVVEKGPNYGGALGNIKRHCKQCCGGSMKEVELCPVTGCILWPFRFGRSPDVSRHDGKQVDPPLDENERVL